MNMIINEIVNSSKAKFGLNHYYLQSHTLSRRINTIGQTVYILSMEWFPNHITEHTEEDSNPDGTAIIDIDLHRRQYESVIFVNHTSFANGIRFINFHPDTIIKWIEQETGLKYEEQFKLNQSKNREFRFHVCKDGTDVAPSGFIEVHVDENRNLTHFSKYGHFPSKEMIKEETYTLTLQAIEKLGWEQLKLINIPSYEQGQLIPVYAIEEIYVKNDQTSTIPYEFMEEMNPLKINKIIYWEEPIYVPFKRREIDLINEVTIAQALSHEQSLDSLLITAAEQKKCIESVTVFLRQQYLNDSGKWILKTLQRREGYIHASLRLIQEDNLVFQRKLTIIIEPDSLQAIHFIDNEPLINHFRQYPSQEITINKKEAYEKIKDYFELIPYYVYDHQQKKYILCGKLDCPYGIHASTGDLIKLDDL